MAQVNGATNHDTNGSTNLDTANILHALDLIHNPTTPNDQRLVALRHLEEVKQRDDLADIGNVLGRDATKPPLVRHFGLSLLEHVIRHKWHQLSEHHNEQFRHLIIHLAETLDQTPQAFIRNKIAELWIELAKRSWALEWYDLDKYLVQLWSQTPTNKRFSLSVLENLSADVFEREDSTAVLRGKDLNSAVVEVFSSSETFAGGIKVGDVTRHVRCSDEGWLARITTFIQQSLQNGTIETDSKTTVIAALATLRSCFTWSTTPPIVNARCLPAVCMCLMRQDTDIVIAALDVLNALYGRNRMEELEVQALVHPLCQPENTSTLQQVYTWSVCGVDQMDSPRYTISKKIAELVNHLTDWIAHFKAPTDIDFGAFFALLVAIAQHDSLIVSIPAVDCWEKLVQSPEWRQTSAVQSCIQPVLQFATQRVIQYDQLPDQDQEPAVLFVNDEIELHPDRQGFYGTYRRFCISIIDAVTYAYPHQALEYLLAQVDSTFEEVICVQQSFDPATYDRSSLALLTTDAQYTVVDAAYRGVARWIHFHPEDEHKQQKMQLSDRMRSWSVNTMSRLDFRDPLMKQRQIKHVVESSNRILRSDTDFAFKVLEHILSSFPPLEPNYPAYSETVSELHSYASAELRRLALEHASYFVTFYDQLESKFSELTVNSHVDEKVQIDLRSSLFLVVQRANGLDANLRRARLETFLAPISSAWNTHQELLSSFASFTRSQAFDQIGPYMAATRAGEQAEWSGMSFSQDGASVQNHMADGAARLPLRETRVLLSVSTEKLEEGSETHTTICQIWVPLLPVILSSILRIVEYNHALHDPSNWPNVDQGLVPTIHRILRDRYWQSGISEGSMVDFHRKVKSTKTTMEGFASSVRGRIRTNLENCYSILHTLGRLGSHFYSMPQIPEMISTQLLQTSHTLGLHHFGTLLSMLPKLIEECPAGDRQHFLTPVLSTLLQSMDSKCSDEWQKLDQRKEGGTQDDSLNDEMREESVLRQMTYRAVNMVAFWLDSQREAQLSKSTRIMNNQKAQHASGSRDSSTAMRDFILSNIRILEPLLVFCNHSIAYKDTKTCSTMVAALLRIIPIYAGETHLRGDEAAAVREYISSDMLKTLIGSLHDGYFADYQNDLATLIATIWSAYGLPTQISPATESQPAHERPALTHTPQQILLSLPGITAEKVQAAGAQLAAVGVQGKSRRLRAIVLQLLEGVRGVRVSELGKFDVRVQHSKILEKYKLREQEATQQAQAAAQMHGEGRGHDDTVDLGGVADMFGEV